MWKTKGVFESEHRPGVNYPVRPHGSTEEIDLSTTKYRRGDKGVLEAERGRWQRPLESWN